LSPTISCGPEEDRSGWRFGYTRFGLLERIRDLNLTLLSVTYAGPSTQDANQE
jgi:hypothetical protein